MKEDRLPAEHPRVDSPAGRAGRDDIGRGAALCADDPVVKAVLEAVDSYAVVINQHRQVLAANRALLDAVTMDGDFSGCLGMRVGEVLGCLHAEEGQDGCGSSMACRKCGNLVTALATLGSGEPSRAECLITIQQEGRWEAHEFAARSVPLQVRDQNLILLTLRDISSQKRRGNLERVFVHGLNRPLQRLKGWTEVMQGAGAGAAGVAGEILGLASRLMAEMEFHRLLLQAEAGTLEAGMREVAPADVLEELEGMLGAEISARLIRLPLPAGRQLLRTDPAILCQVLGHMVLNALEAVPPGGQARIWFERLQGRPVFMVQNPGCMPPEVAANVFQRSFSTKAPDRGLGTYGMKLLGEAVLGAKVGFATSWAEGTRFFIELPADA
jgi:signal transduction histidine kinase